MIRRWIARLFGAPGAEGPVPPIPDPPPVPAAPSQPAAPTPAAIDRLFYRWLTGPGAQPAPPAAEKLVLDEMARLSADPESGASQVPRVPAVVPQLLRSLRDDSVTSADLARQLSQDAVLVGEVIREVNSPYYRPPVPVRSLEGAVMLLGQNGLRMVLARVAFRPIISMQTGNYAQLVAKNVWAESERCALAASLLATRTGVVPFEAYLAGIMHNIGLMVGFRLIDRLCPDRLLPVSGAFCDALFRDAATLSSRIAQVWDFPQAVVDAIGHAGDGDASALARALGQGDQLAKLRMLVDAGQLEPAIAEDMGAAAQDVFEKIKTEEN